MVVIDLQYRWTIDNRSYEYMEISSEGRISSARNLVTSTAQITLYFARYTLHLPYTYFANPSISPSSFTMMFAPVAPSSCRSAF